MADLQLTYDLVPSSRAPQQLRDLERSLSLRDNVSPALGKITGAFSQFDKSLDASNARVLAFGASAGLILGIQRAFSSLVKETLGVEKSLQDINVILGLSSKGLTTFGNDLFSVAKQTGQNFNTVAEAAKELSRQGLSASETLKRVRDSLILTRQSGLDAEDSVKAITAALNSFYKEALDSTSVINKLANVDAKFAVSSKDLAEAISRTGSAASEAGVKFDELIGLVTGAQQVSQRGGAIIAQALNSVFARISRPGVIDQLRELGVGISSTQSGIDKLRALSAGIEHASKSQANIIRETAGGIRNLNVLSAVLTDLGSKYSIVARATDTATESTNEAIVRNEELNKTYAALAARTGANIQQVTAQFGKLTLGPGIENVLGSINTVLEGAISKNSDSAGEILGKGILKGLGQFLGGPGIVLVGAVIFKLVQRLAVESGTAFKTIIGINKAALERAGIEKTVNTILTSQPELIGLALNKELGLLDAVRQVNLALQERQNLSVATVLISNKLVGSGKSKAEGFIPEEQEKMGAYKAGYTPGEVRSIDIPGRGINYYNTAEKVKKFPGMIQPAIIPPENSRAGEVYKNEFGKAHGFNPYEARGYVPNFSSSGDPFDPNILKQIIQKKGMLGERLPIKERNMMQIRAAMDLASATGQSAEALLHNQFFGQKFAEFVPHMAKGSIPNFAYVPVISPLVGRAVTNLIDPFGYSISEKLKLLLQQKPKDILRSLIKDEKLPILQKSNFDNFSESSAIRDFALRKSFGLKPRRMDEINRLLEKTGEKSYSFKENTRMEDEIYNSFWEGDFETRKDNSRYGIGLGHPVMGNFEVTSDPETGKVKYKDVFDIALNHGEKISAKQIWQGLQASHNWLKTSKNSGRKFFSDRLVDAIQYGFPQSSPTIESKDNTYGANSLANLARKMVSSVASPITFEGTLHDTERLNRNFWNVSNKGLIPNFVGQRFTRYDPENPSIIQLLNETGGIMGSLAQKSLNVRNLHSFARQIEAENGGEFTSGWKIGGTFGAMEAEDLSTLLNVIKKEQGFPLEGLGKDIYSELMSFKKSTRKSPLKQSEFPFATLTEQVNPTVPKNILGKLEGLKNRSITKDIFPLLRKQGDFSSNLAVMLNEKFPALSLPHINSPFTPEQAVKALNFRLAQPDKSYEHFIAYAKPDVVDTRWSIPWQQREEYIPLLDKIKRIRNRTGEGGRVIGPEGGRIRIPIEMDRERRGYYSFDYFTGFEANTEKAVKEALRFAKFNNPENELAALSIIPKIINNREKYYQKYRERDMRGAGRRTDLANRIRWQEANRTTEYKFIQTGFIEKILNIKNLGSAEDIAAALKIKTPFVNPEGQINLTRTQFKDIHLLGKTPLEALKDQGFPVSNNKEAHQFLTQVIGKPWQPLTGAGLKPEEMPTYGNNRQDFVHWKTEGLKKLPEGIRTENIKDSNILDWLMNHKDSKKFIEPQTIYGAAGQQRQFRFADSEIFNRIKPVDLINGPKTSIDKVIESMNLRLAGENQAQIQAEIKTQGRGRLPTPEQFKTDDSPKFKVLDSLSKMDEEGKFQKNCLVANWNGANYARAVREGKSLIMSGGDSAIELDIRKLSEGKVGLFQMLGKNNSAVSQEKRSELREYIRQKGLTPTFASGFLPYANKGIIPNFALPPQAYRVYSSALENPELEKKLLSGLVGEKSIGQFKTHSLDREIRLTPEQIEMINQMGKFGVSLDDIVRLSGVIHKGKFVTSNYTSASMAGLGNVFPVVKPNYGNSPDIAELNKHYAGTGTSPFGAGDQSKLDIITYLLEETGGIFNPKYGHSPVNERPLGHRDTGNPLKIITQASQLLPLLTGYNRGHVPNFSAVSDAIIREASAGVDPSQIRLGSSPYLASSGNPNGLGVYNTNDEPGGLNQGIARISARGFNPKMAGVPNFADFTSRLNPLTLSGMKDFPGLGGISSEGVNALNKAMIDISQKIESEGLFKSDDLSTLRKNFTKLSTKLGLSSEQVGILQDVMAKNAAVARQEYVKNLEIQRAKKDLVSKGIESDVIGISRIGQISYKGSKKTYPEEPYVNIHATLPEDATALRTQRQIVLAKLAKYQEIPSPYVGSFLQSSILEQKRQEAEQRIMKQMEQKRQEAEQRITKQIDQLQQSQRFYNPIPKIGTGEGQQYKEPIGPKIPSFLGRASSKFNDFVSNGKFQNLALASSLIAPVVAGTISELVGNKSPVQRGAGQLAQSLGNITSYAALGFSTMNPYIGAATTIGGAALEIPKVLKSFTDKIPDISRELERLSDVINQTNDGFSNLIVTNEKLKDFEKGQLQLTPLQFGKVRAAREEQINKLSVLNPEFTKEIRTAGMSGDVEKMESVLAKISEKQNREKSATQIEELGQIIRPDSAIARFFSKSPTKEDYAKYIQSQVLQPSTEGGPQIPEFLLKNPEKLNSLQKAFENFGTARKDVKELREGINDVNKFNPYSPTGSQTEQNRDQKFRLDISKELQKSGAKDIISSLEDISKTGKFPGLEKDLLPKMKTAIENGEGNFTEFGKLFDELSKELPLEQYQDILKNYKEKIPVITKIKNFGLELEKFGDGLDSLAKRLQITTKSNIEKIQARTQGEVLRVQTSGEIGAIQAQTNPFLAMARQSAAANEGFKIEARGTKEALQEQLKGSGNENIISALSKLKESYFSELGKGSVEKSGGIESLQRSFNDTLSKLVHGTSVERRTEIGMSPRTEMMSSNINEKFPIGKPVWIPGVGYNTKESPNFDEGLFTNLSGKDRKEIVANARKQTSSIEDRLQMRNSGGGLELPVGDPTRAILETQRKILDDIVKNDGILTLENKKAYEKAERDLEANQSKLKSEQDKQMAAIVEAFTSTFSSYTDNLVQLRANIKQAYKEAKIKGLEGQEAKDFIAYRTSQINLPLYKTAIKTGTSTGAEYRSAISGYAEGQLQSENAVQPQVLKQVLQSGFTGYNAKEYNKDLLSDIIGLRDAFASIRTTAREAFASIVDGSKTAASAARQLGMTIAGNILNNVGKWGFDSLFGNLSSLGGFGKSLGFLFNSSSSAPSFLGGNQGGLFKFAGGGMVPGGSGIRDDVPAMLSNGSFVIKRDSVNKYGPSVLKAIDNGVGFDKGGGINQVLLNQYKITGLGMDTKGSLNVSPALSVIGQTDTNNPANTVKFGREQDYFNYLQTKKEYLIARQNFEAQQMGRLIGAYFSAGMGIVGASLKSGQAAKYENQAFSSADVGGANFNAAASQYPDSFNQQSISNSWEGFNFTPVGGKNIGGLIRRYASGGSVDNIPALLTGGEYVMSPSAVQRMGVPFMNRLNGGQVSPMRLAAGGLVGRDINVSNSQIQPDYGSSSGGNNQMVSALLRLVKVNEEIRDINFGTKPKVNDERAAVKGAANNQNQNNATSASSTNSAPQVTIHINMGNGGTPSTQSQSNGAANGNSSGPDMKKFGEIMQSVALNTIIREQRPGGSLQNTGRNK